MKFCVENLWKSKNFCNLWLGVTISSIGSEITNFALPTLALLFLNASAIEVGYLKAAETIAYPILGLFAGVIADRYNQRRMMVFCDIGRCLIIVLIPVIYILGFLNIYLLLVVAVLMGAFTVFFNICYQSFIPKIIERKNLIEGNTKLNFSESSAQIAGPTLAGWLIHFIGIAKSFVIDSISYLFSAITLILIKSPEEVDVHKKTEELDKKNILIDIYEGLRFVFSNSTLRSILIINSVCNMGFYILQSMLLVFAYKKIGITSESMGIILTIGSLGLVIGTALAKRIIKKIGLGGCMVISISIMAIATLLIPMSSIGYSEIAITLCWFFISFGLSIYDIIQYTLRQLLTPDQLLGRMNATMRIMTMGVIPIASVMSGLFATYISLTFSIIFGGIVLVAAALLVITTHIYKTKVQSSNFYALSEEESKQ